MTEQRRMSTAVAEDLASRRRRQQSAAIILARTYDELIDVPMHYWTEAGKQWRDRVLAARIELHSIMGITTEVADAGGTQTEVGPGRTGEQRRRPEREPWE